MHFTSIRKNEHYERDHEKQVPWSEVVNVILTTKQRRKRGDKIEIKTEKYYILCELREKTLFVINAKRIK